MHSNPQKTCFIEEGCAKVGIGLAPNSKVIVGTVIAGSSATKIVSDSQFGKATLCDGAPSGGNEGTDYA
jgi:hypothetical protein